MTAILRWVGENGTMMSLHIGDPGMIGDNEAPLVARQPVKWDYSGQVLRTAGEVPFKVRRGEYTHFGVWTADGEFLTGGPLDQPERFGGNGTYVAQAVISQE